jgi:hypothetical protein
LKSRFINKLYKNKHDINEVEIDFKLENELCDFITLARENDSILNNFFNIKECKMEFPKFLIKKLNRKSLSGRAKYSKPFNSNLNQGQFKNYQINEQRSNRRNVVQYVKSEKVEPVKAINTNFDTFANLELHKNEFFKLDKMEKINILKRLVELKLETFKSSIDLFDNQKK